MLDRPMTADEVRAALRAAAHALAAVSMTYDVKIHGDITSDDMPPPVVLPMDRRAVESCILEAAPAYSARPITMKQLAKLAGYSYSDWFRREVDALVGAGELIRTGAGVRRATP